MVCRNPLLAEERARKRAALLDATEAVLAPIAAAAPAHQAPPARREQNRGAGGPCHRPVQDGQALRVVHRQQGRVQLPAHPLLDCGRGRPRRTVRGAHQRARDRTRCPRDRARVQASEHGGAGLPQPQDRGPQSPPGVPSQRRAGPRPRVAVQAGLLRGMAHARSGLRRCCSTTRTATVPKPPARPSWRRPKCRGAHKPRPRTKRTAEGDPVHSFRNLLAHLATVTRNTVAPRLPGAEPFEVITRPHTAPAQGVPAPRRAAVVFPVARLPIF